MLQTFYIEADEEIISIIGRLRKTPTERAVFVFPKRALVLQSIVNLRLLQRESEKLGKRIVIVTNDEIGRALARKIGIETEEYHEEPRRLTAKIDTPQPNVYEAPIESFRPEAGMGAPPRSESIGSNDFRSVSETSALPASTVSLRVRNVSPMRPPGLNSVRYADAIVEKKSGELPYRPRSAPPETQRPPVSPFPEKNLAVEATRLTNPSRASRLKQFFQVPTEKGAGSVTAAPLPISVPSHVHRKIKTIVVLMGGVTLLSLLGVGTYFFLPRADISVTPYRVLRTADIVLQGTTAITRRDEENIPLRLLTREESIMATYEATGLSESASQKARGVAIIYNEYGPEVQPLVATTRLETEDGKVFRLTESVTVPGVTEVGGKKEPGAIEVPVIADQAGEAYNIGPATFTIPGFRNGPKYAKFRAQSTKPMTGGGSGDASVSTVSKLDIERAEREGRSRAKEQFLGAMKATLSPGEMILDESIEIESKRDVVAPPVGTPAKSFDYRESFAIRAFAVSEEDIHAVLRDEYGKEIDGVLFSLKETSMRYGEADPRYAEGALRIKAQADIVLESYIDEAKLKAALLGKDADGIQNVLGLFPAIKKIEVGFHPSFFTSVIPKAPERVNILLMPGEE